MKRIPASLFAALLAVNVAAAQAGSAAESLSVSGPNARAVPPGQPNSVVFMALANGSGGDHALTGAESPACDAVEVHTHTSEDGMMKMRRVDRVDLPAGETVRFEPGGLHLMLIGLKQQLVPGQQLDLTLVFEDGSRMPVEVPVRKN
ncbi:MAG: copper chaperone PCu(A)C [Pseudomonadota bacterium]|nr:copper chaperone PCu(A)C [Pseudomonadota bacterium]